MTEHRDDSQSLREWVDQIPAVHAWLDQRKAEGVCPGCGEEFVPADPEYREAVRDCFVSISSVWCQTLRRHITPSKEAL